MFNTANNGHGFGCATCHAVNNLGNNPSATTFFQDGTESPSILATLLAAAEKTGTAAQIQMVQDMINNNLLPIYCLRPTSDASGTPCGNDATDVVTTDPGRALVSGQITDAGKFKPPILRDLAARAPFFHAGVAPDMQHLVNF